MGWPLDETGDSAVDVEAPTVILTDPLDLAVHVALDAQVDATFSEPMDPRTFTPSTFGVVDSDQASLDGQVFYNIANRMATFIPATDLIEGVTYTATMTTAATDLAENPLAEDYVWSFTADEARVDTQRPLVILTDPDDLETGVPLNARVEVTFNEAMNPLTISAATIDLEAPDGSSISGAVFYNDAAHIATFDPDADLDAGVTYLATVFREATDLAGNGLADDYIWTFTTDDSSIDTTDPWVIFTIPDDQDTGVALDALLLITFSEAMDPVTISAATIDLESSDGAIASGAVYYDSVGHMAIFDPYAPLLAGETYTASVSSDAADLAGNRLATDYVWTFTTDDSSIDRTPPRVILTDPFDLDTFVPVNTFVEATFSEAMDPLTLSNSTFELVDEDGMTLSASVFYDVPSLTATLVPDVDLLGQSTYTATVYAGASDLAGNGMNADYTWTFTTEDVIFPEIVLTVPLDLETSVDVDSLITFTFSELMDPLTIVASTFDLVALDGTVITGSLTYDEPSMTGTFAPTTSLLEDTTYVATVNTDAMDLDGLAMASDYQWSFRTDAWALARVDLRSLETFVAVAGAGLTNSNSGGVTTLGGDVGLSPTGTCLGDGVPCTLTNPVVLGTLYIADATAAQAKADLSVAYADAMGRPPGTSVNDISGLTLAPGVYTSGSTMSIAVNGIVTLDGQGDPNAVWIFQIGSSLTVNNNAQILLIGGADADNVFWSAAASSTLGSDVSFQGSVLAGASNSVGTRSVVVGRLLCTTGQITLLANTITLP